MKVLRVMIYPDLQQRAAPAFDTVVCEELGDLIMARLPVRDLVRTRSVCKYLRASMQLAAELQVLQAKAIRGGSDESDGLVLPDPPALEERNLLPAA
jgi:hypothetical protein